MAKSSKAKMSKTGKIVEAPKTTPKATKNPKISEIKLSETDKSADTENYIKNPNSGKYVKRTTVLGKKLSKAEKEGTTVDIMTDHQRLIFILKHLQNEFEINDEDLKKSLTKIKDSLPRSFPAAWGGKHKEARHPEHPKGPSNAYIHYTTAVRKDIMKANPNITNTEAMSMMSEMWKALDENDKAEYEKMAKDDKVRYDREMTEFEKNHPDQARKSKKSTASPKPTKASAYTMFCKQNRETFKSKNPEADGKEISKLLAEEWAKIKEDPTRLEEYKNMADEANEKYEELMSEYEQSTPKSDSSKKLSKAEQAKKDDPENYELNEKTGRYVKKQKSSPKPKEGAKSTKPRRARATKKVVEESEDESEESENESEESENESEEEAEEVLIAE